MPTDDRQLNGVSLEEIFKALELLQDAGLDTSSVTMSLTHMLPNEEEND